MDIAKGLSEFTASTAKGMREFLSQSLQWSSDQIKLLSDSPVIEKTGLVNRFKESADAIKKAQGESAEAMENAFKATADAFHFALQTIEQRSGEIRKSIVESIPVASVLGESFLRTVKVSEIESSWRLNREDADSARLVEDIKASGKKKAVLLVPGLFCDETLWTDSGTPKNLVQLLDEQGFYPIFMRFNPGRHISDNGEALLSLILEILPKIDLEISAITYSQGGLVLRSALYQDKEHQGTFSKRLKKAVLVSSPDGGSYIEKIGFWVGLGLESSPLLALKALGFLGNQRSEAIKDLSHGIIRQEDWQSGALLSRYAGDHYFGELDDIDAYQVYSLVSTTGELWKAWLGDGIVEEPSLKYLSERVYLRKGKAEERTICIYGKSHFQILSSEEMQGLLTKLFV